VYQKCRRKTRGSRLLRGGFEGGNQQRPTVFFIRQVVSISPSIIGIQLGHYKNGDKLSFFIIPSLFLLFLKIFFFSNHFNTKMLKINF
jgi:hypothetical protein